MWWNVGILFVLSPVPFAVAIVMLTTSRENRGIGVVIGLAINGIALSFLPMTTWLARFSARRYLGPGTWFLRQAAAIGDETLLPPVYPQPEPLTASELEGSEHRYVSIKWLDNLRYARAGWISLTAYLVVIFFYFCAIGGVFDVTSCVSARNGCTPAFSPLLASLFPTLSLPITMLFASSSFLLQQRLVVHADGEGLRWRAQLYQSEKYVRWSQVRSIMQIHVHKSQDGVSQYVYVLDAGDAVLSWGHLISSSNLMSPAATQSLLRLALTCTGLTLRDAEPLGTQIRSGQQAFTLFGRKIGFVSSANTSQLSSIPGLSDALARETTATGHRRGLQWLAVLPLAGYIVFCIIGWIAWS